MVAPRTERTAKADLVDMQPAEDRQITHVFVLQDPAATVAAVQTQSQIRLTSALLAVVLVETAAAVAAVAATAVAPSVTLAA